MRVSAMDFAGASASDTSSSLTSTIAVGGSFVWSREYTTPASAMGAAGAFTAGISKTDDTAAMHRRLETTISTPLPDQELDTPCSIPGRRSLIAIARRCARLNFATDGVQVNVSVWPTSWEE